MYRKVFKRLIDIVASSMALIVLLPFFALIALLIRLKLGSPVIFEQKRPGKDCKIFTLYKFRTMTNAKDEEGNLLLDSERLTKFGKFLRKTSIDELPELWNILKGDMSIVGPRPLLVEYLPLYNDFQNKRHEIRPGLTGLAQVSGRNAISWEEKFEKDVEYIDKLTLINDIKIILLTIKKVLKSEDISQEGQATMEYFTGNSQDILDSNEETYEESESVRGMNNINVLILSAGRRVELVKAFKDAQANLNMQNAKVIGVDMSKNAPALYFCDKYYIIPSVNHPDYIKTIIDISNIEDIGLIIPTIDTELCLLADNKILLESSTNAKVLISDSECIDICNNKAKTIRFMQENGFNVPRTYSFEEIEQHKVVFPLFVKPCFGSSSKNIFIANNEREINFFKDYVEDPIVQEMIIGDEYTVDVCLDFQSNIISVVPRVRLSTRSGEILQGKIDKNRIIIDDVKRLMNVLKPIGHITVQCFFDKGKVYYIEINPRFGGGAPMSFYAGANSPEFLFRIMNGEQLSYFEDYQDKMVYSRFDSCIKVEN